VNCVIQVWTGIHDAENIEGMRSRLWLFFKTAGKLGWGGLVLAILLFVLSFVEHLQNQNFAAYSMVVVAALAFCFGAYDAWDVEHQSLLSESERHAASEKTHEETTTDLRARIQDLQTNLTERGSELERIRNSNRPEVFVWPSETAVFKQVQAVNFFGGLIEPTPEYALFACDDFGKLINSGRSVAYEIEFPPVVTDAFSITVENKPQLEVGANAAVSASLRFPKTPKSDENTSLCATDESGFPLFYEVSDTPSGKQVQLFGGFKLKVTWRDSSRNHFFSTSKDGKVSFIESMPAPLTDEEMQEAYEQQEGY
jgi:hypothetical protein